MSRYERNPFERARGEAPYTPRPTWVTSGLLLGLADDDAAVARDGDILDRWDAVVGDDDPVWILGGVGDPAWLLSLPGRLHVVPSDADPDDETVASWRETYGLAGCYPGPRSAQVGAHRKDAQPRIVLRAGLAVTPHADQAAAATYAGRCLTPTMVAIDDHRAPIRLEDA